MCVAVVLYEPPKFLSSPFASSEGKVLPLFTEFPVNAAGFELLRGIFPSRNERLLVSPLF